MLLPASAWSPFRGDSFLTPLLPWASALPPGPSARSPVRGGRWQEGGGSFLTSLLPWASAFPPGPYGPVPRPRGDVGRGEQPISLPALPPIPDIVAAFHPSRSPLLEGGGPPQRARDPKSPGGRGPSGPGQGGTSPEPLQRLPTGSFARPQGAQNQMPLPVLLSLLFSGICRGYVVAWKNAGEPQAYSGYGPVRPILFIGSRATPWSLFRPFLASQKWAARTGERIGPG